VNITSLEPFTTSITGGDFFNSIYFDITFIFLNFLYLNIRRII
jgi:hypothetical protein